MMEQQTSGSLDGVVVLDATRVFAGPFATQILGDLGADVIKVERTGKGDECRDYGVDDGEPTPGAPFLAHNRNKRSISLDLKTEAGRQIFLDLSQHADVVIHNFRTGVMERLGLGYSQLSTGNPRLIMAAINGFGAVGSMATRAANDLSIQSYSGLMSITGHPGGAPTRNPSSVADLTAGMYAVVGILSALMWRERTGLGQELSTSMLGGQLNYLNHFLTDYWLTGRLPQKWGTANRLGMPNQAFPTSDGWVCITSANDAMWRRCAEGLDIGHLADDPRFALLKDRYANRDALVEEITAATERLTTRECLERMAQAGVPCVPVNSIDQIAHDPVLEEIDAFVDMEVEGGRVARLIQTPIRFSRTPVTARLAPPKLGEHTEQVLAGLGYDDETIARLRSEGAVQ